MQKTRWICSIFLLSLSKCGFHVWTEYSKWMPTKASNSGRRTLGLLDPVVILSRRKAHHAFLPAFRHYKLDLKSAPVTIPSSVACWICFIATWCPGGPPGERALLLLPWLAGTCSSSAEDPTLAITGKLSRSLWIASVFAVLVSLMSSSNFVHGFSNPLAMLLMHIWRTIGSKIDSLVNGNQVAFVRNSNGNIE